MSWIDSLLENLLFLGLMIGIITIGLIFMAATWDSVTNPLTEDDWL